MRLAVVAWRQRQMPPEFSSEVAGVAESPAMRDRCDREVRVHQVGSGRGETVLSDDGSNGVSRRFECAVDRSGRNVVYRGEILDLDGAGREVVDDPGLELSPQQRQELALARIGTIIGPQHPGDQGQ